MPESLRQRLAEQRAKDISSAQASLNSEGIAEFKNIDLLLVGQKLRIDKKIMEGFTVGLESYWTHPNTLDLSTPTGAALEKALEARIQSHQAS